MDDVTQSREIIANISSLEGKEEHQFEYIKALIAIVQDDKKHVLLYITADFAIAAIFLTQTPAELLLMLPLWARVLMVLGIAFLGLSSVSLFRYVQHLHLTQMAVTRCLPSVDVVRARELLAGGAGVWKMHGKWFGLGGWLMGAGVACLIAVLVDLYVGHPV
jgi:hypothetical protein